MNNLESNVKSYCRTFPVKFIKAYESILIDESNKEYIDFFTGAGTMNYGHNNSEVNRRLVEYIKSNGILHGLDLFTEAKEMFLRQFNELILLPRKLNYRVQFVAPSGANGVEAAIKLARKAKRRNNIVSFSGSFHGMSLGALSVTGNSFYKNSFLGGSFDTNFAMFDSYLGHDIDTADILEKMLQDPSSGLDMPAAIILETIQADGGVNIASCKWLQKISNICTKYDILLIIDDVQVGNGRSGDFFSFEEANIVPDMVVISKAIGGGMPLSLVLIKPEIDEKWKQGEHTGTFRGNNLAFIAGATLLEHWGDENFSLEIKKKGQKILHYLNDMKKQNKMILDVRGRGLIFGIELKNSEVAKELRAACFSGGLIFEIVGSSNNVIKLMPPLTISEEDIEKALNILTSNLNKICGI